MIGTVNFGWAAWALVGAFYFLTAQPRVANDPALMIFGKHSNAFAAVGISLLACGLVSLLSLCVPKLGQLAAILCAVWSLGVAVTLQIATPHEARNDIYAWLLLICAFTCVMRWALLVLEPHLVR